MNNQSFLTRNLGLWIEPVTNLFFPNVCTGCNALLGRNEDTICTKCRFKLPKNDFHLHQDNPVARKFWGRMPVGRAAAYLNFQKKTIVQNLLHELKYKKREDVGVLLGQHYGYVLSQTPEWIPDMIIPVPLHPDRFKQRGYNQSACFAQGLSLSMNCPYSDQIMIRTKNTTSQTKMDKQQRFENMQNIFKIDNPERIKGQKILLVDDVITTGATLEICGNVLLNAGASRLDIAAIAFGQ